jgi:hypothetical protein
MGDAADMLLDGTCDEQTGEYIGPAVGYPRTMQKGHYNTVEPRDPSKYSKSTREIRKELAILIKEKHKTCTTDKEKNIAVNDARQAMNQKYGKGWREQL